MLAQFLQIIETYQSRSIRIKKSLTIGIAMFGVILRMRQYLINRSLWLDEALLALNLVDRSFARLIQPLDYGQAAPIGFLFIQKAIARILGNRDCILRIFPLLAGIISVFLMWRVAEQYLEGMAITLALCLFSISDQMVYYASEVKQYSSDALISLLLLFYFNRFLKAPTSIIKFVELCLIGILAMWISHPALFTIAGLAITLILDLILKRKRQDLIYFGYTLSLWIINFAVLYFVSLSRLTTDITLIDYWRHGFMPMPLWRNINWLPNAFTAMFHDPIGLSMTSIGMIAFLVGCSSLFFRKWQLMFVLITPLLAAMLAAMLKKYPFSGRLLLFIVPAVILLIAEGIEQLRLLLHRYNWLYADSRGKNWH